MSGRHVATEVSPREKAKSAAACLSLSLLAATFAYNLCKHFDSV